MQSRAQTGFSQLLILFFIILGTSHIKAENKNPDHTIARMSISQKLPYDLEFNFANDLRYKDHSRDFNRAITEFGLGYEGFSDLEVQLEYRFIRDTKRIGQRVASSVRYDIETWDLEHQFRVKYQEEWMDQRGFDEEIRLRYLLRYDGLKRIQPFISHEVYSRPLFNDLKISQQRSALGLNLELSKVHTLKLYYMLRKKAGEPESNDVLAIQLNIEAKSLKLKKKKSAEDPDQP